MLSYNKYISVEEIFSDIIHLSIFLYSSSFSNLADTFGSKINPFEFLNSYCLSISDRINYFIGYLLISAQNPIFDRNLSNLYLNSVFYMS